MKDSFLKKEEEEDEEESEDEDDESEDDDEEDELQRGAGANPGADGFDDFRDIGHIDSMACHHGSIDVEFQIVQP